MFFFFVVIGGDNAAAAGIVVSFRDYFEATIPYHTNTRNKNPFR